MLAAVRRNSVYSFFQYKLKNEDNKVRHVLHRGTSLIRNTHPPRITIDP